MTHKSPRGWMGKEETQPWPLKGMSDDKTG